MQQRSFSEQPQNGCGSVDVTSCRSEEEYHIIRIEGQPVFEGLVREGLKQSGLAYVALVMRRFSTSMTNMNSMRRFSTSI
jgi:hypothetical protein